MALYDWPINQYKFPSEGLLYQNVNPYADSMGLMSGAYSPWSAPAVDFNYTGDPWFKGPDVTWSSPDTDYAAYMQGLADAEAEAIRNSNNNNPYYNNGGEDNQGPVGPNTGPVADYVDAVFGNMANMAYGVQNAMAGAQTGSTSGHGMGISGEAHSESDPGEMGVDD